MTKRRIIHAFDAGPPPALAAAGLDGRFRVWRGISGQRHLTTIFKAGEAPAVDEAVAVLARREADGTRVALWAGRAGDCPQALNRLAAMKGADEIHMHLIAPDAAGRRAVERDLVTEVTVPLPV